MKHTILIVDDNPSNLGVITACLEEYGYKTPVATDGEIAIKRAKHVHPDLILLDILMPEIDGFETCRRLKADEVTKDIPIIFMTALTNPEDKINGFRAGAVDYITKPIQQEEVLARIETHLRIRDQTVALTRANAEIRSLNEQLNAENMQVRADLQKSQQKYATLVEQITEGHFVLQNGRVVFANQAFCDMHGYQLKEVLGKEFALFIAPESRQNIQHTHQKCHQPMAISHVFEYMRLTKSGQRSFTEMTTKAMSHEVAGVTIGTCRDVTERVEIERKMREAEHMAYIGRLTTSLSHEIRNPLSAIKMNLQMLEEYNPVFDEDARRNVSISIKEVMRLENILSQLLDFARPLRLDFHSCHINQMIASCVEVLKAKFEQNELRISCALDPEPGVIQADGEKLAQVMMNLLLNAFEASQQDTQIWISSRFYPDNEPYKLEVIVQDEGPGISEENIQYIFKPFFTTKKRGTGLGLTNVKHIVEAHGGRIEVENRKPHGAIFRVWLSV